jgi:hypothetical protein
MDDGSFDDRFAWHPDPIVEAMRRRACEGELIQAIGRLRSIRSKTPKKVLLVTNVIVPGIVPNRGIPYRELKRGKCHATAIDEYIHRLSSNGDVVPLGAAEMVKLAPDLFPNPKAAEDARREIKSRVPLYNTIEGWSGLNEGSYRRRGQRGKPCRALIKSGTPAAIAKGELERLVGPLADFNHPDDDNETERMAS